MGSWTKDAESLNLFAGLFWIHQYSVTTRTSSGVQQNDPVSTFCLAIGLVNKPSLEKDISTHKKRRVVNSHPLCTRLCVRAPLCRVHIHIYMTWLIIAVRGLWLSVQHHYLHLDLVCKQVRTLSANSLPFVFLTGAVFMCLWCRGARGPIYTCRNAICIYCAREVSSGGDCAQCMFYNYSLRKACHYQMLLGIF